MENSVSDVLTSVLSICSEAQKKKNLVRRRTLIHFRSWSWVLFLFSTRSTTELGEKRAKAFTMTFLTFHRTKKKKNQKSNGGRNWLKLGKVKAVQRLVNQPININLLCVCVCVHVRSGLQSKEYVYVHRRNSSAPYSSLCFKGFECNTISLAKTLCAQGSLFHYPKPFHPFFLFISFLLLPPFFFVCFLNIFCKWTVRVVRFKCRWCF